MHKLDTYNKGVKALILLFGAFLLLSFFPNTLEKKINRILSRTLDLEQVEYTHIDFASSKSMSNIELFHVIQDGVTKGYFSVTLATGCNIGGCNNNINENDAFEFFYMMVVFDDMAQIQKVKILEYDSEFGYEIMAPGWLKQFEKNKKQQLKYIEDIDGISGATVSAESVVDEVNASSFVLRDYLENSN